MQGWANTRCSSVWQPAPLILSRLPDFGQAVSSECRLGLTPPLHQDHAQQQ